MGLENSWNKVSVFAWADRASVIPFPSLPGSQAATRDSTLSRTCGSITIGLPEIRIITVGALSATKLAISVPFSGIVSEKMAISGNTLQPTISSKDLSANGCSNIPEMNLTLKILSTASSILAIGISPDCAKHSSSSRYNSNLKGTMTYKQHSNQNYETPYLGCVRTKLNLISTISIPALIAAKMHSRPPIAHEMLGTTNNFVSGYSDKPTVIVLSPFAPILLLAGVTELFLQILGDGAVITGRRVADSCMDKTTYS
nr:Os05g0449750 [Ipomoea batatas]